MPAWAARPAVESRLISTTINRPPLTMRAAKVAANPVEVSVQLHTRPQFVGDGEAGGGGAAGA